MNLSIVIPVYNSANILNELITRIENSLIKSELKDNFEIVLVNDSSKDDSWEKIKKISAKYSRVKGINLSKNFGQHNALIAGLNYCKGKKIITMDDDLQHPPESIIDLYNSLQSCDAIYTYYKNRRHIKWKKAVSWLNNIISSFLLNKPFHIYLSSFRGFNESVAKEIIKFKKPNVYLDSLILKAAKKIDMITVVHSKRYVGYSNYNFKKLLILWSNMVINSSFKPIRISSLLGFILKIIVKMFKEKEKNNDQYLILEKTFNE